METLKFALDIFIVLLIPVNGIWLALGLYDILSARLGRGRKEKDSLKIPSSAQIILWVLTLYMLVTTILFGEQHNIIAQSLVFGLANVIVYKQYKAFKAYIYHR